MFRCCAALSDAPRIAARNAHYVSFPEELFSYTPALNANFESPIIRFTYSYAFVFFPPRANSRLTFGRSLVTPNTVYEYHMETRLLHVVEPPNVPGYNQNEFIAERLHAPSRDGMFVRFYFLDAIAYTLLDRHSVPISLVYRKDLPRDEPQRCLLYVFISHRFGALRF